MTYGTRRLFAGGAVGVAITEMLSRRSAGATDEECHKDWHCDDGEVCHDNECVRVERVPCEHDDECDEGCVCHEGGCATVTVINNNTVVTPVYVTVSGGRRRRGKKKGKKKGGKRR